MRFSSSIPSLTARDLRNSIAFYHDRLGFKAVRTNAGFALLRRDSVDLHLWAIAEEDRIYSAGQCRIEVDPVGELFEEMGDAGVLHPASRQGVRETEWGTFEFDVLDLDGNRITFFQEMPEAVEMREESQGPEAT